jgi:hypothetical protein
MAKAKKSYRTTTKVRHKTNGYAPSPLISSNLLTTGVKTNPITQTEPKPYGG